MLPVGDDGAVAGGLSSGGGGDFFEVDYLDGEGTESLIVFGGGDELADAAAGEGVGPGRGWGLDRGTHRGAHTGGTHRGHFGGWGEIIGVFQLGGGGSVIK